MLFYINKKRCSICGQEQKSLLRSPLKLLFSKLCTTLSTQIVDKHLSRIGAENARRDARSRRLHCTAQSRGCNAVLTQRAA
jgi:hypothetical protein